MKRAITAATLSVIVLAAASPALAALKVGDTAPDFTLPSVTAGKLGTFSLKAALKSGPVVVYFYPKAFTGGCSLEAHQFSEAVPTFASHHMSVIGISTDDVVTLQKFSLEKCQGKFPVASDGAANVSASYDARMPILKMSNRTSYIVGTDGRIVYVHEDANASTHVPALLAAASKLP